MRLNKFNEEVLFAIDPIVKIDSSEIDRLKNRSTINKRKRIRLCTHNNIDDNLHEMFIVHAKDTYVKPHKHMNKAESLHIIEGLVDIIVFNDEGDIRDVFQMGDYLSGRKFYQRISDSYYHSMIIRSEFLVFHEATTGPFRKSDTLFPTWAPEETDINATQKFITQLSNSAMSFISIDKFKGANNG